MNSRMQTCIGTKEKMDIKNVQASCAKHVLFLVTATEELGNPFAEESQDDSP